jgi:arylsulfatase
VYNLRGDDGAATGGLAVDTNLGWKGADKYVATVPQVFDLWQDPQERYDIFMNNLTESTWALVPANEVTQKLMKTSLDYPPRPLQSETYTGPITHSRYFRFQNVREELEKQGFSLPMPTGN